MLLRSHGGGNCSGDGGAHEGGPDLHPTEPAELKNFTTQFTDQPVDELYSTYILQLCAFARPICALSTKLLISGVFQSD